VVDFNVLHNELNNWHSSASSTGMLCYRRIRGREVKSQQVGNNGRGNVCITCAIIVAEEKE
jgi:hypothetical protein